MNINQRKTNKYSNPAFSLAIKYICIFVYNFINVYRVPFQGFTNILFLVALVNITILSIVVNRAYLDF